MSDISNLKTLSMVQLVVQAAWGLCIPFLPIYYQSCGLSWTHIGTVSAVGTFAGLFGKTGWARLSDLVGSRKFFMVWAAIALAVTLFAYTLVCSYWPFLVIAVLSSLLTPPLLPLATAIIFSQAKPEVRASTFATYRIWGSVGLVLATLAGGWVVAMSDMKTTFRVTSLLFLLAIPAILKTKEPKPGRVSKKLTYTAPAQSQFLLLLALLFIPITAACMVGIFLPIYLNRLGAGPQLIGVSFALTAIPEIPIIWYAGRLADRVGRRPLLMFASVSAALRYWLYAVISDPILLLPVHLLNAVAIGSIHVAATSLISDILPREQQGVGQTLYLIGVWGLAGTVGPYLGGLISDAYGLTVMFYLATLIAVICAPLFMKVKEPK
jgi:PPP family 3-phenylpropionic acid transporter